jgi:hypothetical protein
MAKGKFDPNKHGHSEAYRNMHEIMEKDKKQPETAGYGHSRAEPAQGKRGALYEIEVFKPSWHPVGEAQARGSKELKEKKRKLTSSLKRGSYRVKVYNKTTGKEVGGKK